MCWTEVDTKGVFDLDKFLGCKDVFNSAVHPPGSDSTHVVHVKVKVSVTR